MRTFIAEPLGEQVGGPVDDVWLAVKARGGGDEPDDLHHPAHRVDTHQGIHRRQGVEHADPRQGFAFLRADLSAALARVRELSVFQRELARRVDEVPGTHCWNVGGQWRDHLWKHNAELPKPDRCVHQGYPLLRPLQVGDVLLTSGPGQYRHQLPAIGAPLIEYLFGGVRQQWNRGVLPRGRLAHDVSLSVGREQLWPARRPADRPDWKWSPGLRGAPAGRASMRWWQPHLAAVIPSAGRRVCRRPVCIL